MKNKQTSEEYDPDIDGMPIEFPVSRREMQPNRFADRFDDIVNVVTLDREIAEVFRTSEEVNEALRSLLPKSPKPPHTHPSAHKA